MYKAQPQKPGIGMSAVIFVMLFSGCTENYQAQDLPFLPQGEINNESLDSVIQDFYRAHGNPTAGNDPLIDAILAELTKDVRRPKMEEFKNSTCDIEGSKGAVSLRKAITLYREGKYIESVEHYKESSSNFIDEGNYKCASLTLSVGGGAARVGGDKKLAVRLINKSLEMITGDAKGDRIALHFANVRACHLGYDYADYANALTYCKRALELTDNIASDSAAWSYQLTARILDELGEGEAFKDYLKKASILFEHKPLDWHSTSGLLLDFATLHCDKGEKSKGKSLFERSIEAADKGGSVARARVYRRIASEYNCDEEPRVKQVQAGIMSQSGEISRKDIQDAISGDTRILTIFDNVEAGDQQALELLAELYRDGVGVGQDYCKARKLFELAADQLSDVAFHNLAYMSGYGHCGPRNPVAACVFLKKSAAFGNKTALEVLQDIAMREVECSSAFMCIGLPAKQKDYCVRGTLDASFECRELGGSAKEACMAELNFLWGAGGQY